MTELLERSSNMTPIPTTESTTFARSGFLTRLIAADFSALNIIQPQTAFRGDASPRAIHFFPPRNGCDVDVIDLPRRDLHGSLAKEFRGLRALASLNLRDTNVTGNLDVLKESTALRYLRLQNTRIAGDLQSLAKVTGLWRLYLRGTLVSGDLVALSNAKDLEVLYLSETKVYGDLVALSNVKDLGELDLSETKVYGDLASLANLTALTTLKLSSTKVSGDFSVILQWKKIQHLSLSGSEVTSHPTEKWQNCCERLETLYLAWTEVRIVDGFLANFPLYNYLEDKLDCPFPALTTLNMTGTPLNTTVEKLFSPFVGCEDLRMFIAAECSLTGRMPTAVPVRGSTTWQLLMWAWLLTPELLDLSSNNVTEVTRLPRTWKAVSFRGNPQISFGEDVVKKATEHFVSLDLRNATFAHPSDTRSREDLSTVFKCFQSRCVEADWCSQSFC